MVLNQTSLVNVDWSGRQSTPAGKATAEDPTGSGFLPRRLKRCPRKATAWNGNQHSTTSQFMKIAKVKKQKVYKNNLNLSV
ncbi:hypothetical protein AOX59_18670 [Lentibacillus amyloliquefaciens]|uniref:Uncharacterized protein n=1 Tax=Lentibacillus amyloliquefaciens TaxID=1472767 RepID=A0A0U4DYG1_9BACI|nr:hypothetical protein AOX59_18670 [Lentibacillus amyloliquefaciens]